MTLVLYFGIIYYRLDGLFHNLFGRWFFMKDNDKIVPNSQVIDVIYGKFSIISSTWQLCSIDEGFTKITGYTQEDINTGLKMLDFIPSEDLNVYLDKVASVLAIQPECYLEHRILKKNGDKVYVLCYGRNNDDGIHSNIVIADITKMVQVESNLNNVKNMFSTIIDGVPSAIAIYQINKDKTLVPIAFNKYCFYIMGFDNINKVPTRLEMGKIFPKEKYMDLYQNMLKLINFEITSFKQAYKIKNLKGDIVWIDFNLRVHQNEGELPKLYTVMSDVTKLKTQIYTIRQQKQRYELIQNLTNELYFEYDLINDIITLPKNIETLYTGTSKGNCIKNFYKNVLLSDDFIYPDDKKCFLNAWNEALIDHPQSSVIDAFDFNQGSIEFRMQLYSKNQYNWCRIDYILTKNEDDVVNGLFGKIVDISESHLLKDEIELLSTKDAITGLENKTSFCQKFNAIITSLDFKNKSCAILSLDINDFSYINDNFSYEEGNNLLIELADLLSSQKDFILNCRLYSDYFYCLIYSDKSKDELMDSINEIFDSFNLKQKLRYSASNISICAGIFFINDCSLDSTVCMDNCNLARNSIKNDTFTSLAIFDDELRLKRSREKALAFELNEALQNNKIEVFLQPKFNMKTFDIIGAEALVRWRNDDGSLRSPVTFIPVLEKLGHIVQLDFYVFEQVLKLMDKWKKDGVECIPISINFSRIHNNYDNFVQRVLEVANKYDVDKSLIELEITESAFIENNTVLLNNMKALRSLGFKINIDDFGIGYSSLSVLLDAPVDVIKLDKKFIDDLMNSTRKQTFLKQLCILISTTNKNIIFEGVELSEQAKFLCSCGFYMAQGWLFDKAIPSSEFEHKYIYNK